MFDIALYLIRRTLTIRQIIHQSEMLPIYKFSCDRMENCEIRAVGRAAESKSAFIVKGDMMRKESHFWTILSNDEQDEINTSKNAESEDKRASDFEGCFQKKAIVF